MKLRLIAMLIWLVCCLSGCQIPNRFSGTLITAGVHSLASDERLAGDVLVIDGSFAQPPDATITGSVLIVGGQVDLAGKVDGNVTLLGGSLSIAPGARIVGDLLAVDGSLIVSPLARVHLVSARDSSPQPAGLPLPTLDGRFIHLLLEVPLLAGVAYLGDRRYPAQITTIGQAFRRAPWVCLAVGLLAALGGLSLAVLMAYIVLLIPLTGLLLVWLLFTTTFGAIPVAVWLGRQVLVRLDTHPVSEPKAAAIGMVLLAVLTELLRFLPVFGDLLTITFLLTALGAAWLTRCGAAPYPSTAMT